VSSGIIVVKLLRGEVVYLHINREREFWCSPGTTLFQPDRGVTLAAAERIGLPYNMVTIEAYKSPQRGSGFDLIDYIFDIFSVFNTFS
jgi:hypothetical protein